MRVSALRLTFSSDFQRKSLNDPYTGGLSSYGLVLMVAFALLRRDHFPPSPTGPSFADADFIERPSPDRTTSRRATSPPSDREKGERGSDERRATPPPPDKEKEERGVADERRATPPTPSRDRGERGGVGDRLATPIPPSRENEERGGDAEHEQPKEIRPAMLSRPPSQRATPPPPDKRKKEHGGFGECRATSPPPDMEKEGRGGAENEQPEEISPTTSSRTPSRRATPSPPERDEKCGGDERGATPPSTDTEKDKRGGLDQRRATPPNTNMEKEERGGAEREHSDEACLVTTVSPRSRSESENRSDVRDSDFSIPPSPGHSDGFPAAILQFSPASKVEETWGKKSMAPAVGRQRGFWQRPSLTRGGSGFTGMLARDARAGNRTVKRQPPGGDGQSMSSWDRCGNAVQPEIARWNLNQ